MRHPTPVSPPVRRSSGEAMTTTPTTELTATPTTAVQEPRARNFLRFCFWNRVAAGRYPAPVRATWQEWGHVVLLTVALVPLAAAVAAGLAQWRTSRDAASAVAWQRSVAEVGMIVGTVPWLWMILTPRDAAGEVHLLPLRDLAAQLAGDPGVLGAQVGGNLLVFAAFGALAPLRFRALARLPAIIGLAAAGSLAVETMQYVLALGRVSSVDDVLLNAAGAGMAGLVTRRWWRVDGAVAPCQRRVNPA
jgi:hypothetical protein